MKHFIAVVGYGNPTRSDDGAGIAAAELIGKAAEAEGLPVKIFQYHQLTIDAAPLLLDYKFAIFLDSGINIPHGSILFNRIESEDYGALSLSHHLKPQQLLMIMDTLFGSSPESFLCTIGGRDFDFGNTLSDKVAAALPEVVNASLEIISQTGSAYRSVFVQTPN